MFNDILSLLQSHICSQGLNDSELRLIAERTAIVDCAAEELLYRAGEPVTTVFLVVHGRFRMSAPRPDGREQQLAYFGPGSQLGVLSIFHEEGPPVNVAAEEPSTVLRISKGDLIVLVEQVPQFRRNLLRLAGLQATDLALGRELRNQPRYIAFLHSSPLTKPLVRAVTRRLLELEEKIGMIGDDSSSQKNDPLKYSIVGPEGSFVSEEELRKKIGQWADCKRIIFDIQANLENEREFHSVARLMALVDGGILNTLPANVLVRSGATFVVAVNVSSKIKNEFAGNTPQTPTEKMKSAGALQTVLRMLSVQDENLSAIGAGVADFTIAPDVSAIDISEFSRTPEIAAIGRTAAEQALPKLRQLLYKMDAQLFPLEESLVKSN